MLQAVDREVQREYLQTLVIAKAYTLDRENSGDVDGYNKILKQYHDAVFLGLTKSDIDEDESKQMKSDMDVFRNMFAGKSMKVTKSKGKLSGESFSSEIKDLGQHVNKK